MPKQDVAAADYYFLALYDRSAGDQAIDDDDYRDHEEDVDQTAADMYNKEPK